MNATLMKSAGISVASCSSAVHVFECYIGLQGPCREFSADRFRAITRLWRSADLEMHNVIVCSFSLGAPPVAFEGMDWVVTSRVNEQIPILSCMHATLSSLVVWKTQV